MFKYSLNQDTELRLLEPRYAEEIYALIDADRARLQQWLDWVERTNTVDDTKAYCKSSLEQCAQEKGLVVGIWHRGRFAGTVGLEDINPFVGSAEIGYWLGEEFEGHGLVTNTCRALLSHAFTALGAHRVEIYAVTENTRSRRVAERLGFHHEGTRREAYYLNGRFHDLETYAILERDWTPRESIAFSHSLLPDTELRLLLPHYAEEIFALVEHNREHLRWMTFTEGTRSIEDIRGFIRHTLQEMANDTGHHWAIAVHGRLAGVIGAGGIDRNARKVEIGYWLAEEFQGQGLMTQAGRKVLAHLFETVGLNRLEIRCDVRNIRSRALAERLGFVHEGTKRQVDNIGGEFVDMHYFGLLRDEWEKRDAYATTL